MIDTMNLSDRAVNLLARWTSLDGGPLGSDPSEIDPETAILVEEYGVITRISDPEEFGMFIALTLGVEPDEVIDNPEMYLAPGVRLLRGIAEVK